MSMFQNNSEHKRMKGQYYEPKNEARNKLDKVDDNQGKKYNTLQVSTSHSDGKLLAKYIELEKNLNEGDPKSGRFQAVETKSISETQQKQNNNKGKDDYARLEETEELKEIKQAIIFNKEQSISDSDKFAQEELTSDIKVTKDSKEHKEHTNSLRSSEIPQKSGTQSGQPKNKETHSEQDQKDDKENKLPIQNLREELVQTRFQHEEEVLGLQKQKMNLERELKDLKNENLKLKQELGGAFSKEKAVDNQGIPFSQKRDLETFTLGDLNGKSEYTIELENKVQNLIVERDDLALKLSETEDEIRMKDKQIEGLKFDVNHMKDFIFQHHSESLFGPTEEEEEVLQKTTETSELKSPQKPEPIVIVNNTHSFQEVLETEHAGSKESKSPLKVQKRKESVKDASISKGSTEKQKSSKIASEEVEKNEGSLVSPLRKSSRNEAKGKHQQKEKEKEKEKEKDKESDTRRLEKLVKELNEKLLYIEKNTKKEIESKILEASKQFQEREQKLHVEIEVLKEDKKSLLKKIEDIEWERAYEYSERIRKEKLDKEMVQQDLKKEQNPANLESEAKKKKKKKKKTKTDTTAKDKNDSDSD